MPLSETRRRSAGLGCRATTFGVLLAGIPSVTSDGTDFLVCGAGVFFGFATELEVGFLGMTDVYLNTCRNSQSWIAIRVCESGPRLYWERLPRGVAIAFNVCHATPAHGRRDSGILELSSSKGHFRVCFPRPCSPYVPSDPDDDPVVHAAVIGRADAVCTLNRHFYNLSVLEYCRERGVTIASDVDILRFLRSPKQILE